jgi:predicted acylesterase/phospholipase RssA
MATDGSDPTKKLRSRKATWLEFYWDHFLTQFCRHPPLPLLLLLVVALLSGQLGAGFGIPHVIKYEEESSWWSWKQFFVGFGLAIVTLECLFIGFLLQTADQDHTTANRGGEAPGDLVLSFWRYATGILACVVGTLLVLGVACVVIWVTARYNIPDAWRETVDAFKKLYRESAVGWPLTAGAGAAVVMVSLVGPCFGWLAARWYKTAWGQGLDRRLLGWREQPQNDAAPLPRGFVLLLVILAGVGYVLVTRVGTDEKLNQWGYAWWCGLATAVLLAVLVPALLFRFAPKKVQAVLGALARNTRGQALAPYHYHAMALLFTVAGLALFIVLANLPFTASPVVIVCPLLFVLLAVYGFLRYAVSRTLPLILGAVGLLILLGGLNPYKFRFPGMEYKGRLPGPGLEEREYRPVIELAVPNREGEPPAETEYKRRELWQQLLDYPLDLAAWSAVDQARQGKFDDTVRVKYDTLHEKDDEELTALKRDYLHSNRVLPGKDMRPGAALWKDVTDPNRLLAADDIDFLQSSGATPAERKPLVIVAVSGGGLRSAAWTFAILQQLELACGQEGIDFPSHLRIIAGASGGMLGAAYYVTTLPPPEKRKLDPASLASRSQEMQRQYERLTRDCLTPITKQLVFGDLPLLLSPWPAPYDRGQALEDVWRRNLAGDGPGGTSPLDATFEELRSKEKANACPSLVFSPMLVEDGRRLLVSNLDLRYVVSNDGNLIGGDLQVPDATGNYSHEAVELFRLFPEFKKSVRVSTAVRMSASFPFFSPAVPLPTRPRRRVVDAGYYDNYGVSLAAAWLFDAKHQPWIENHASKVVLIQIRDGLDEYARRLEGVPPEGSTQVSRALEELTSPLEGLDNARIGSSSFRNDGQLELLSAYFHKARGGKGRPGPAANRYFTTVILEFPYEVSLSWYLTPAEKKLIYGAAAGTEGRSDESGYISPARYRNRIDDLVEWWKAPVRDGE